ncbi:glucokinase [Kineobactrum sediminis]|uniref:Glucokinase n=1 Tax=Kineobactrum sediminis TaxID=1905677 RepID=A0A2N5Y581_9GAMM|nr:glucokinase [Kineobactrum sediminis]PLW83564.1 glucokinase [Kineobactrum sediminis]
MTNATLATRLVADVGGTNTRLALYDYDSHQLRAIQSYTNRDEGSFETIIGNWLQDLDEPAPEDACIAVAAPPDGDRVVMSNMDWSISRQDLATQFGFNRIRVINDFESNAYALPHLGAESLSLIHRGEPSASDCPRLATIGPGTGLGGAVLQKAGGVWDAIACEPGHMALAPVGSAELEIWRVLSKQHPRIYTELLVSGPGLVHLYGALAEVQGIDSSINSPEEISRRGVQYEDQVCVDTLALFCRLLGTACADFVLANGSYGGLYLAGGILPRMLDFFAASGFPDRFIDRGPVAAQLERMPINVVTHSFQGLLGAGNAPLH